ncbi:hypothetical protein [Flavobacterium poyangense]|uniref:hypothetical protein n=1 Tax=Flavobacterium poyangense TaxID=2204302 RepID=UPI00141F306E|nr:hypothetical protein [Flavobacterium sp. JXAS1]
MKTYFSMLLLFAISIAVVKAQEKQKDTIFFSIEKHYTISPTITPYTGNKTYTEVIEVLRKQMRHTKTNGYIFFIGDGYLIKNLKPKKILSIKEYIENAKFYYNGTYNKIVDKWKLKDSLTDKYTLFFVNGDQFIQPRHLEYASYYPTRDKNWNVIDNKIKDTLFFKLDNQDFYESKYESKVLLLKSTFDSIYGAFFFNKVQKINDLKPNKIFSFNEFVRSSRLYDKNRQQKVNDNDLWEYLNNYVVFLVEENDKRINYIQVQPSFAIE